MKQGTLMQSGKMKYEKLQARYIFVLLQIDSTNK
jgi:hypothetical protein